MNNPPQTKESLRKFGLIMAGAFAFFASISLWRGTNPYKILYPISAVFLAAALICPLCLASVEKGWMWLGERIGRVMTVILLTVTFFLVITPLGLVLRLVRRGEVLEGIDKNCTSYWKDSSQESASRLALPF